MLRVVIADDENIVRIGLSSLIDWNFNGYKVTGLFADGKEALNFCLREPPDIVITDIEMPGTDGLELIDNLRKRLPSIRIIVLSNYDKFQYVSTSYKHGASDYLLKQFLEPVTLLETLNKLRDEIGDGVHVSETDPDNIAGLAYDFLNGKAECAAELQSVLEQSVPGGNFCAAGVCFKNKPLPDLKVLCSVLENTLSKYGRVLTAGSGNRLDFLLAGTLTPDKVADCFQDIQERFANLFALKCTVGHSGIRKYNELTEAKRDAETGLNFFMFIGAFGIIFDASAFSEDKELTGKFLRMVNTAGEFLRRYDFDALESYIKDSINALSPDNYVSLNHVFRGIKGVFVQLASFLSDIQDPAGGMAEQSERFEKFEGGELYTAENLLCALEDIIAEAREAALRQKRRDFHILRICAYIEENFQQDLSLKNMAKRFHLSAKYLSREFKRRMGVNFSEYLNRIRIKAALSMMGTTRLTTEEIAERSGFSSANYFVRVFKKVTGRTVTENKNKE